MSTHNFKDLADHPPFGRLTIINRVENNKRGQAQWKCQCICGNIITVVSNCLSSGHTKSCGCIIKEITVKRNLVHGMSKYPEYRNWACMTNRCHNPNNSAYKNYGGRGITVCDEWRKSFPAFYKHIGPRPSKKHSIDRIRNSGNYEPGNVRWADRTTQNNNSRQNHHVTIDGITKNIAQWANITGINRSIIAGRLKAGWSPKKAVMHPIKHL